MNGKDAPPDPLEPSLSALLGSLRDVGPRPAAIERVWSRVAIAPVAPMAPPPASSWLASHAAVVATTAFVAGAGVGAAIHATVQKPPAAQVVYVDRRASSLPPTPAPFAEPLASPSVPAVAPTTPVLHAAPSASGSIGAEHALLESARTDLSAGRADHALSLLADHARRFPKAQLAEEREALVVQCLVTLGRYDEARATAAHFRTASPQSIFLPTVESSLGSIP